MTGRANDGRPGRHYSTSRRRVAVGRRWNTPELTCNCPATTLGVFHGLRKLAAYDTKGIQTITKEVLRAAA